MTLPDAFLEYPARGAGPDHARYPARPGRRREPVGLPGGARLGVWVTVLLEFHPLNPRGAPFKAPGAMQTPYPDLRHYTARDYGNRVGVYRLLDKLGAAGARATFAVQGAVAERHPALVEDVLSGGHEVCAHGWDSDSLHHAGLEAGEEAALIARTLSALEAAGARPEGWISPARAESGRTPDLLAAAGVRWFADWAHDDAPTPFETAHGTLAALPLSNELDDWQIIAEYRRPESEWVTQIGDAARLLHEEAARLGPQVVSMTVRPYLMGQPHRIVAFAAALAAALTLPGAASVTGGDLAAGMAAQGRG